MLSEKIINDFNAFIDKLPERVAETPREVLLGFVLSKCKKVAEISFRNGVYKALEILPNSRGYVEQLTYDWLSTNFPDKGQRRCIECNEPVSKDEQVKNCHNNCRLQL